MKETDLGVDFRALYLFTSGQTCSMYLVQEQLTSKKVCEVQGFSGNPRIKSIALNCMLQADIEDGEVGKEELLKRVNNKGYRPHKKVYVKEDGTEMPTDFVFIDGTSRNSKAEMCYSVFALNHGETTKLFDFRPEATPKLEDLCIINFEIERFLTEYQVKYLDEIDIKWLFTVASEYLRDEHIKVKKPLKGETESEQSEKRYFRH